MMPCPQSQTFFYFNDTPTPEIYTLSLHDALPILVQGDPHVAEPQLPEVRLGAAVGGEGDRLHHRSEEHTSELQSRGHLVCRLLLEKNNKHGVSATSELDFFLVKYFFVSYHSVPLK